LERIVVYGASDHGKYTIDILERQGEFEVAGVIDDSAEVGTEIYGYPILGRGTELSVIAESEGVVGGVVAVGDNFVRHRIAQRIRQALPRFRFVRAIHPSAVIGRDVSIGEGTVMMAGAIVNGSSAVGRHCFIATKASLDHDSAMADFTSLSPNATTGGRVTIGTFSTVSIGATVKHGVSIGEHSVIGAGATVLKDVPPRVVAYGSPCKVVRSREPGDRYL